jgi:hypothetical protein
MPLHHRTHARINDLALLVGCIVMAGLVSLRLGQDANWDLQNYHYYNPWAWWHGRIFTHDLAAAQLQTFHNALFDLPFLAMVSARWSPRVIAFVLAAPAGIAAFFLAKLLPLLFADLGKAERRVAVFAAFAIGVTAAMGVGVLGTTMNEWPLVALTMGALWLVVRATVRGGGGSLPLPTAAIAGAMIGLASGGKLTAATFAVGLCVALLVRSPRETHRWRRTLTEAFVFGLGVLAGVAVTLGPWAWALWTHYDSPIFPYGNEWIKSPWWGQYPVLTRVYGPHNLGEWLLFPFNLLGPGTFFVAEVPYRDARWPVTWALAIIAAAAWVSHRVARKPLPPATTGVSSAWRVVSVFVLVSFLLWTAQHSVYRYIVVLDMLTGALIVTLLQRLLRPGYMPGVAIMSAVAIIATTHHADWWRIEFGRQWFDVAAPAIDKNALVLITTEAPVSYVLPFLPPDARHLGVANSINAPSRQTRLADTVNAVIRDHRGPLYQLTFPAGSGSIALEAHGLARVQSTCTEVRTGMLTTPIEICRVERVGAPASN